LKLRIRNTNFNDGINYLFCKDDKVLCEINCDDKLLLEMGGVKIVKEYGVR
jgi:hypothetical protein